MHFFHHFVLAVVHVRVTDLALFIGGPYVDLEVLRVEGVHHLHRG